MQIKENSFSIVVVGRWNMYILTPQWIGENFFKEEKVKLEVPFNLGLPFKYTSEVHKVMFVPANNKVTFIALDSSEDCLNKMEEFVLKLVEALPVTPVSAAGINFGYVETNADAQLQRIFEFTDNNFLGDYGCHETNSSINRRFIVRDRVLNFNMSKQDKKIDFDFNFHYEVSKTAEIKEKIRDKVIENKNIAEDILKTIYRLGVDKLKEG